MKGPVVAGLCAALAAGCGSAPSSHVAPEGGAAPIPEGPAPSPVDAAPAPADGPARSPSADAAPAAPAGWWDAHWTKRALVTIADPELKEELADFQVPVALDGKAI